MVCVQVYASVYVMSVYAYVMCVRIFVCACVYVFVCTCVYVRVCVYVCMRCLLSYLPQLWDMQYAIIEVWNQNCIEEKVLPAYLIQGDTQKRRWLLQANRQWCMLVGRKS